MYSTIERLLTLRKKKIHEQNIFIKNYKIIKQTASDSEIRKMKKSYEIMREEILNIEDDIAEIDASLLDDIIEPNPDNIDDALSLFTDDEWKDI